jgi:hypothetical protein
VLAKGKSEQIVLGQHLGETDVVRDECGDDADSTTGLAKVCAALEVSYSRTRNVAVSTDYIPNIESSSYRWQGARM